MKSSKEFVESIQEQQKKEEGNFRRQGNGNPRRNYRIKNINEAHHQKIPALY